MRAFAIYSVKSGNGAIALSPLPGSSGQYATDLSTIRDWRPDLVISMTTSVEMQKEDADRLGKDLRATGIDWCHFPVEDFGAPSHTFNAEWVEISATASQILSRGGRVLVHCRGGCGRSGMIVLRLMVEQGENADSALNRLRAVQPCAVETEGQMNWAIRRQTSR